MHASLEPSAGAVTRSRVGVAGTSTPPLPGMDRHGNILVSATVGPLALHIVPVDEVIRGSARALCGSRPLNARRTGRWRKAGLPIAACNCRSCWSQDERLAAADALPDGHMAWKCVCGRERGELGAPLCSSCCSIYRPPPRPPENDDEVPS